MGLSDRLFSMTTQQVIVEFLMFAVPAALLCLLIWPGEEGH